MKKQLVVFIITWLMDCVISTVFYIIILSKYLYIDNELSYLHNLH
jgi:hypothetical protein